MSDDVAWFWGSGFVRICAEKGMGGGLGLLGREREREEIGDEEGGFDG